MAYVDLQQNANLSVNEIETFLKERLRNKYQIYTDYRRQTRMQRRIHGLQQIVVVKRNALSGAFLRIEQKPDRTRLKIWWDAPSTGLLYAFILIPPLLFVAFLAVYLMALPVVRDVKQCFQSEP